MTGIPLAARLRRSPRVAYHELGGVRGSVLLQIDTGAYHGLNPMGTFVWIMLGDSPSFEELVHRTRGRLDEVPNALEPDIREVLSTLRERDLIQVGEPSAE